ncbi:M23 family metallopeptidase [Caldinitratiruptor microaerophilus]|uniref:M23ase beta-sheet core domain-containing protein n=1 Tax=Caldinitratiruptor microaerophilus TaxID=671077 RepID=A0AA35CN67_9FIRM|nr:M23 family metallopeptidase [Caldinitratiruptor microaerophilus]BDG61468.1 hypothetical protein caldi_25580 [Caldinitratiruptor microaerophilus]
MRERVRQVWPDPSAGVVPERRRPPGRLRQFLRREDVAETLSRLGLQTALAAALVGAALLVRWLPFASLDGARRAVARHVAGDFSVSDAWRRVSAWAAREGGWSRAVAGVHGGVRARLQRLADEILPPAPAPGRVDSPPTPPPALPSSRDEAPLGTRPPLPEGGVPVSPPGGQAAAPAPGYPGLITLERPGSSPSGGVSAGSGATAGGPSGGGPSAGPGPAAGDGGGAGARPVAGEMISPFGWRGRAGGGEELHEGVDLAAEPGAAVRALRAGVVARVGRDPLLGPFVEVDHGGGLSTRYAPVTPSGAGVGRRVEAGQVLGVLGEPPPGEPWRPHLHLEVRQDGRAVDPAPLLGAGSGV